MNNQMITCLCVALIPSASIAGGELNVTFVDHIKAEMVEQDVYVEKEAGKVFRVTTGDYKKHLADVVFTTATGVAHDPMNAENIGPFAKGHELGFTLGDWLNASGTARISCADNKGNISAEFTNLVPNGLYTMWQFFVGVPFPAKFHTYDMPVGVRDGGESTFTADGSGAAIYNASFEPCLQGSGSQLMAGLAIAYHSDGKTYGWEPGSMGDVSHVHLFVGLPPDAEMPH